ncbi:uncharacterized protein LOC143280765 [Babylonia areolata]|uniref:uncharacterized protein LOC143280765 n=1 Tax=Babylonia areolata TaxID=304850 RepID=UPI003FD0CE08
MPPKLKGHRKYSRECVFCYSSEKDDEAYGKMLRKAGITIHYFCMLFSSGLWQRGKKDSDGILGFMPSDIRREQKRGVHLMCDYCKKKGASISCSVKPCQTVFHFRCGREAGGLCQFYEQFRAFCPEHRPHQTLPAYPQTDDSSRSFTCCICMQDVVAQVSNDTLCAPCCGGSWFHRNCIQRYAVTAGKYFFKCPLCNNKDLFESEMLKFGIYIPEQDAAWELEPNAYHELLERYSNCDADKCQCPQGRQHVGDEGSAWELLLCSLCGSTGTHVKCGGFVNSGKDRVCSECAEITSKVVEKKKKQKGWRKLAGRTSNPHVANSVEEVRQQLEDQRSCLLRSRRAARRQTPRTAASEDMPSTSEQQKQSSESEWTASEEEELTPVASPSLLNDRRLVNSTPVVRIERASSEIEVNVLDSDEEETEAKASENGGGDARSPGCARLITLPHVSSGQQLGQQRTSVGSWKMKEVIEKGEKKVVRLSVHNQQGSSNKDGVQSTTSALQRQLTLQPVSGRGDAQQTAAATEDVTEALDAVHHNQKHKLENHHPASDDDEQNSSEEQESGKEKSPFLITKAHRAAFRRMIPSVRPPPSVTPPPAVEPKEVFQISDSEQEDADDVGEASSSSGQTGTGQGTQKSVSREQEPAKERSVPQTTSETYIEIISLPTQNPSCNNLPTSSVINPRPATGNSAVNIHSVPAEATPDPFSNVQDNLSAVGKAKTGVRPSILRQGCPSRAQKTAANQQMLDPAHSQTPEKTHPVAGTATQNSETLGMCPGDSAGMPTVPDDAVAVVTVPDDVVAMHQPIPPAFAQFQVPKPNPGIQSPARSALAPPSVPFTVVRPLGAPDVRGALRSSLQPRYPVRPAGVRPHMNRPVSPQDSPRSPSVVNSYSSSPVAVSDRRHCVPPLQHGVVPPASSTATAVAMPPLYSARAPGVDQPYFFTIPNTQSFVGVLAVHPSGSAPLPQSSAVSMPATPPFSVTVMAGQPQPAASANAPAQFIPVIPQNGMPFLQIVPLSHCLSSTPQQSGGSNPNQSAQTQFPNQSAQTQFPNQSEQTQFPNQRAQSQCGSSPPQQSVMPTLSSPPAWPQASDVPQSFPVPGPAIQASSSVRFASPQTSSVMAPSTQPSSVSNSDHHRYLGSSQGHAVSSAASLHSSVGQQSLGSQPVATIPAFPAKPVAHSRGIQLMQTTVDSYPPPLTARDGRPVRQTSAPSVGSPSSVQPSLTGTRPRPSHPASWQFEPSHPVSQPNKQTASVFATSQNAASHVVQDRRKRGADKGTPVPVALYSHSPVSTPVTSSRLRTALESSSPANYQQSQVQRSQASVSRLQAAGLHSQPTGSQSIRTPGQPSPLPNIRQSSSLPTQRAAARATAQIRPATTSVASRVALVPPRATTVQSVRSQPPTSVQSAVPVSGQQSRSSAQATASPGGVPTSEGESPLAISRGKIWLASEPLQSQKNNVVLLSDSDDDGSDLEITGTTPGKSSQRSPSPKITGVLVPAPNKPPCPVHGHFRLVHHPKPSAPAKRNTDGYISIDLTEDEAGPKKARTETVLSDNDSDLEIIS